MQRIRQEQINSKNTERPKDLTSGLDTFLEFALHPFNLED